MKAIKNLAKVRRNVGALAPRFLFTFVVLTTPFLVAESVQANARAAAVANAELLMQVEQMQQEVKNLRNMVEQQDNALSKMQTEQRNRYLDLDQRTQEYAKRLLELEDRPIMPAPNLSVPTTQAPVTPSVAPVIANVSLEKDRDAYNKAYAYVPEQRFDDAVRSFQDFIRQYPNSRLVGNAYYWLGEIYMVQNRTADAEKMFNVVIGNYPDSFKIADSKYKLGIIYSRYGNEKKAQETMEAIVADYPREPAADHARSYLKK